MNRKSRQSRARVKVEARHRMNVDREVEILGRSLQLIAIIGVMLLVSS